MYRFKGMFDIQERKIVSNTFILANLNYCPIIWYFYGKVCTKKKKKNTRQNITIFVS